MRLNSILKPAVIITLFLSFHAAYAQPSVPLIIKLEGLNEGKDTKISMVDGIVGTDFTIQYRLKNTSVWIDSPVKFKKGYDMAEEIISGLESSKNYCFRAINRDSVNKTEIVSNEVCSISLKATLLSDKEVKFEWDKPDADNFEIVQLSYILNGTQVSIDDTIYRKANNYVFKYLKCSEKYNFFIIAYYSGRNDREKIYSFSPLILVDPKSLEDLPTPKGLSSASVQDKSILYNIHNNQGFLVKKYNIYRSVNGGEMIKIGESDLFAKFEDKEIDLDKNQYCYAYTYVNECGTESPLSEKSCPIFLSVRPNNKLVWTSPVVQATSEFQRKGTLYSVEIINSSGKVTDIIYNGPDTTFSVDYNFYKSPLRLRVSTVTEFRLKDGSLYTSGSNSNIIDFLPVIPPFITQLEGLNEGKEAKISMNEGNIGESYIVQYRPKNTISWVDSPIKIKKSEILNEGIVTGLESNKNYCFRLIKRDSITKSEVTSNEVCSISLKSALLSEREVRLEWSKPNSDVFNRVFLTVMEENGMNMNNIYPEKVLDTTFIYNQLYCSARFKFNVNATFSSIINGIRKTTVIKSPQILVDPKLIKESTPPQGLGVVSIEGNNIKYSQFSSLFEPKYELYKSVNGGEMIKFAEVSTNTYIDTSVEINKNRYCYAFKAINECNNISKLSGKSCTIKLSSETYGRLSWTPFIIESDSNLYKREQTEYNISLIDDLGAIMSIANTTDTTVLIDVEHLPTHQSFYNFRILATMKGKLNFNSQVINFPIFSYSNTVPLYLILGNESSKANLIVYPNPTKDRVFINSSGAPLRFIELIDMNGRTIHKEEISGDTLNLSAFEKGKYILRLYDANKKLLDTKNIVKW